MRLTKFLLNLNETENLSRWFAGSKIVDNNGNPLKLYHGTSKDADFKSFKMPKNGIWFTPDPKSASEYAEENDSQNYKYDQGKYIRVNTASRVIPCYVRAVNPIYLDEWPAEVMVQNYRRAQGITFDKYRSQGYDAIIFKKGLLIVVIGNPNQVKSAIGNVNFDPNKKGLHENKITPAQNFMDAFFQMTHENFLDERERILGGCLIEAYIVAPNRVHLSSIRSMEKGKGTATASLKAFCDLATQYGVEIEGTAKSFGNNGLNTNQLLQWYVRHGFKLLGGNAQDGYNIEHGGKPKTLKLGDKIRTINTDGPITVKLTGWNKRPH